jgi:hypothetical protein
MKSLEKSSRRLRSTLSLDLNLANLRTGRTGERRTGERALASHALVSARSPTNHSITSIRLQERLQVCAAFQELVKCQEPTNFSCPCQAPIRATACYVATSCAATMRSASAQAASEDNGLSELPDAGDCPLCGRAELVVRSGGDGGGGRRRGGLGAVPNS